MDNHVSGNSRNEASEYWWHTVAKHNLKPKIIKVTDLSGVTKIIIGKDESPVKRRFKDKQQREYEAKLRKNIELRKNIKFLN